MIFESTLVEYHILHALLSSIFPFLNQNIQNLRITCVIYHLSFPLLKEIIMVFESTPTDYHVSHILL